MTTTSVDRACTAERWNDTAAAYPSDSTVPELFLAQAQRSGQRIALVEAGVELNYAELADRATRLAGELARRGAGPGSVVGVYAERSIDGVVGILSVLLCGAAYLPLSPKDPPQRTSMLLADAGARLVAGPGGPPETLASSVDWVDVRAVHEYVDAALLPRVAADDPAYLIYTSGSTGKPKGVSVSHRGPVRLVRSGGLLAIGADDTVLATTSLTFDVSCWELFGALLNGARLVLVDEDTLLSPSDLEALIHSAGATAMWLSAGVFHRMAQLRPGMFASLRRLVAGGDALHPGSVRAVLRACPSMVLLNGYGPTENATFSTTCRLTEDLLEGDAVPIGQPVPNSTAYVVTEQGALADVGEVGELWVGGDGVALGYHGDPELTAHRFVPDQFGTDRSGAARLYRTGDLARWRPDGLLDFFGRRDRQVKIRGFRVELREVELALAASPAVQEAVVDLEDDGDDARLAAWVVPATGQDAQALPATARRFLADRLPAHLVPSWIMVVPSVPLTVNGKVDRQAVRAAATASSEPRTSDVVDPVEAAVARCWQRLLGTGPLCRGDDFFALGGQSLQAAQIAAAIRSELPVPASAGQRVVRALLREPTLARFAAQIQQVLDDAADPERRPVDFHAEAVIDLRERLAAARPAPAGAPRVVLLTGATGFLGTYLLSELVRQGVEQVYCLVRPGGGQSAAHRLASRMYRFGGDYAAVEDRVRLLPGDLSQPQLGLDAAAWDELAQGVDAIVHNGSQVNFAYSYDALRDTNVEGTRAVLELAASGRVTPVHYVSSIAVLAGAGSAGQRHVAEDDPLMHPERISLGYPETKWVAEQMVRHAGQQGLPVATVRPYEITGTRDTGVWNLDTMMCALFKSIADTRLAPDIPLPLDFVPVDYTAEAIAQLVTHEPADGRTYHLTNPAPSKLGHYVERLRQRGYPVREVPYDTWVTFMVDHARQWPEAPMAPYLPMFTQPAAESVLSVKELYFTGTFPSFSRTNLEHAIAGAVAPCPPVDDAMLDRYLDYFAAAGYLTTPDA